MTSTTSEPQTGKLIHVACIFTQGRWHYLFLRKATAEHFAWYQELQPKKEQETPVFGHTIEEALRLAARHWKEQSFRTLHCGFRYTLPERDEHGINALFHQMIASHSSNNGVYYDEELGNNCYVQNASDEAYQLWKRLTSS